ncbi:VENN motif pre-toxin domain-containing protein, partial [Erwinia amylovora]
GSAADTVAGAQAGKNAVENNYLSQKQQAQKDKEIAACQSVSCKAGAQAKWTAIDLGQDGSFAAGMVAGVPAALYDTVDGIVKTASSPVETYQALKALFSSGDVLGNVSDAVKQSYIDRIDRMETQYQQAGASGSFNAGVEGGKLISEIASLAAGGAGVAKGGAVLVEKVAAKVVGKAESAAAIAGKTTATNIIKNKAETQASVDKKLTTYLLEKEHPVGGSKAEWFDSALGFNKANSNELAKQIVFDPAKAVKTAETQFGVKYDQVVPITGANGRTIDVKFGWIKNNDGVVRLVTAIPTKK